MPHAPSNGLKIFYTDHGPSDGPAVIMIQGLGMPSVAWPQAFIDLFTKAGYRVITFDNRDMGKSTILDDAPRYKLATEYARSWFGFKFRSAYTLDDMKDDALGLMDHLSIDKAHIIGLSMGGMIAQLLACHHPDRTHSLTSIMSTTGYRGLKQLDSRLRTHLMSGPKSDQLEDRVAYNMITWSMIASPAYPASKEDREAFVRANLTYGIPLYGVSRQTMAIMAAKDRRALLKSLYKPALVIHGREDILIPVDGGIDTADHIPGARLEIIDGMGHDMPAALMPKWFDLIETLFQEAAATA